MMLLRRSELENLKIEIGVSAEEVLDVGWAEGGVDPIYIKIE